MQILLLFIILCLSLTILLVYESIKYKIRFKNRNKIIDVDFNTNKKKWLKLHHKKRRYMDSVGNIYDEFNRPEEIKTIRVSHNDHNDHNSNIGPYDDVLMRFIDFKAKVENFATEKTPEYNYELLYSDNSENNIYITTDYDLNLTYKKKFLDQKIIPTKEEFDNWLNLYSELGNYGN